MSDAARDHHEDPTPTAAVVSAAVALLREAEAAAQRTREETDRYVRDRERDVELLLAKARRVLRAAEVRASVIVANARIEAAEVIDLDALAEESDEELRHVIAPGATTLRRAPTQLDHLFASAINNAVDSALGADEPS